MPSIRELPVRLVRPLSSKTLPGFNPREDAAEVAELSTPLRVFPNRRGGRVKGDRVVSDKRRNRLLQYIASNATERKPLSSKQIAKTMDLNVTTINEDLKYLREHGALHWRKDFQCYVYWVAQ